MGGGNESGLSSAGRGFSALNTGLQPPSGPLIATAEVYPNPPPDDAFPDPIAWETKEVVSSAGVSSIHEAVPAGCGGAVVVGGSGEVKSDATKEVTVASHAQSDVESGGYRRGKWLWEWHIVSCSNRTSVGVCGHDVAVVSAAGVPLQAGGGDSASSGGGEGGSTSDGGSNRADLWLYRSDGHLSHGGESTERMCPGGGFESGDVVGVELDADAGTVAFLKNDSYVGGQFKVVVGRSESTEPTETEAAASGLYPCVSLRGSGDAAVLLGLKEGPGTITYRPPPKDDGGGHDGDSSRDAGPPSSGEGGREGIAAALTAAVAAATAAAEAVAAAAASTVGGGDVAALAAAEAAADSESAADIDTVAIVDRSETTGKAETDAPEAGDAGAAGANESADPASSGAEAEDGKCSDNTTAGSAAVGTVTSASADGAHSTAATATAPSPTGAATTVAVAGASCYPAYFHGEFVRGLKHGPGVLRLSGKGGYWRGKWFQGVQHGVHLLVEPPAKKSQVEGLDDGTPTAWVFDRGVKVTVTCV